MACAWSDLDLLQLLVLLLQAEATAPINGERAQVLEPTRHSLRGKGLYVNVQEHQCMKLG
jgi:hypothetical protein